MNLVERFGVLPVGVVEERLRWREGSLGDYGELSEFHYLRESPVTGMRVLVVEDVGEGVEGRWRRINSKFEIRSSKGEPRCSWEDGAAGGLWGVKSRRVVGVLVESLPALSCVLRDVALGGRYSGWRDRGAGARLLNAEVRCISRVVVHPQWRGVGLAVGLVRRALETMTTAYTEALAVMGRVHPFFRLAGMREYRRWPHARDQRLIDVLAYCGIEAWEVASEQRMHEHLERNSKFEIRNSKLLRRELARWAGRGMSLEEQLVLARERLMGEPVYYVASREELVRRNDE